MIIIHRKFNLMSCSTQELDYKVELVRLKHKQDLKLSYLCVG